MGWEDFVNFANDMTSIWYWVCGTLSGMAVVFLLSLPDDLFGADESAPIFAVGLVAFAVGLWPVFWVMALIIVSVIGVVALPYCAAKWVRRRFG